MNQTQIDNFLLCLTHIDDANYLRLHTRAAKNASTSTSSALHHEDDHAHEDVHDHEHDHDHDSDSHDLLVAKIVAMVVLFCATSLIGSIPFLLNRHFKWTENNTNARSATIVQCLLYFGGGVLLCTTFLHLLPEVQETIENLQECGALPELSFALAEMLMCGGFFLMYLVEELIHAYIYRHKRLLQNDAASAAFERGHSVRNSYLVKGKRQQDPQIASAPPPQAALVESGVVEFDAGTSMAAKSNGTNSNIGLSAQDLVANDVDQQKYQQEHMQTPTKYADQSEHLDHHHNHQHHHHHHQHDPEHHQHHHHHHHAHGHSHLPPLATDSEDTDMVTSSLRGLLIVLALSLHELFEGMAIGLEGSASDVWFMFGAVSAHKLVLAFCVAVELIVARTRFGLSVVYVLTFGIVSPIGIGIGILVSHNNESTAAGIPSAILQGLACGTLLYVVFFEILSKNRSGLVAYLSLLVGFAVMFGLQQIGK